MAMPAGSQPGHHPRRARSAGSAGGRAGRGHERLVQERHRCRHGRRHGAPDADVVHDVEPDGRGLLGHARRQPAGWAP
ncbi:hypothetical protein G6F50_017960 [Rhizopus delemar]|uniref:Uncharacterized protein n=1 Tax=Rhizopus delemar TaxID=936053 RepID=A0A9P6XNJ2_9FUNG|nr:hypothetical protein G6F50_017960 [Rhizopus delemar]